MMLLRYDENEVMVNFKPGDFIIFIFLKFRGVPACFGVPGFSTSR